MSNPSITITREQAVMAQYTHDAFAYAAKRFRDEHSLIFTPKQISSGIDFMFERDKLDRAFRITYVPGFQSVPMKLEG